MSTTLRYSLLRLLLFFAVLFVLWLVGLRDPLWLALTAATVSMLISMFALSGLRQQMANDLADRAARRAGAHHGVDEEAEDGGASTVRTPAAHRPADPDPAAEDPDAFR